MLGSPLLSVALLSSNLQLTHPWTALTSFYEVLSLAGGSQMFSHALSDIGSHSLQANDCQWLSNVRSVRSHCLPGLLSVVLKSAFSRW